MTVLNRSWPLRAALVFALTLPLHVGIGWGASGLGAGLIAFWWPDGGLKTGIVGVSAAWGSVILYDVVVAPAQVAEMARVVGSLLGGLPPSMTYLLTILIGGSLGFAYSLLGRTFSSRIG